MDSLDGSIIERRGVLFVDDEDKALKYFERAYGVDFKVFTACSVAVATEILATHGEDIAILITDKRMPAGDGLQLIADVKANNPEIIRLLTTAYHDADDAIRAINEGEIFRYIPKPWNIEKLREELVAAMNAYDAKSMQSKIKMRMNKSFLLAHMISELGGPLHTMSVSSQLLKLKLPSLLAGVRDLALAGGARDAPSNEVREILALPAELEFSLKQIHAVMDVLLANVSGMAIDSAEFETYSITDCIIDAVQLYPIGEGYSHRVHLQLKDDFNFQGSDELLILVMFNLLRNALHSLDDAGKGEIVIQTRHDEEYNSVHVRDTGRGISAANLAYIFDEYFTTKTPCGGLGLGLSFCKKAIESLGGKISCESVEGEFCEIIIQLPKHKTGYRKVRIESEHVH